MTEYEQLMNEAGQALRLNYYANMQDLKFAFVDYIEARSKCYSRKSIVRDAITCIQVVRAGREFQDRKHRIKHDPYDLQRIRSVTTQNAPTKALTEDEQRVQSVLEWIRR